MQNKELQVFISAAFAGLLYYLGIVAIPIVMLIFTYGIFTKCSNSLF